eukprot:scaffold10526_cov139-Amphora_coffeaeformis.AAC.2
MSEEKADSEMTTEERLAWLRERVSGAAGFRHVQSTNPCLTVEHDTLLLPLDTHVTSSVSFDRAL